MALEGTVRESSDKTTILMKFLGGRILNVKELLQSRLTIALLKFQRMRRF